ncbi:uncharacterized protein EV422DRAFT_54167 [Fimicolochytrium jonesii]|uniref:uncharacterized protein n=1 Tax=Fimicolochytrium jonesii TaxID=1396493 RepID=UPI0022FF16F3|nr:uncharacterized protein EV422DRAFT_54167 [Fimicolochytrium jonesii]KAI8821118.1 hypothetical protein EV422DRAFT_54167 [Fimicolochytrium jonesii]
MPHTEPTVGSCPDSSDIALVSRAARLNGERPTAPQPQTFASIAHRMDRPESALSAADFLSENPGGTNHEFLQYLADLRAKEVKYSQRLTAADTRKLEHHARRLKRLRRLESTSEADFAAAKAETADLQTKAADAHQSLSTHVASLSAPHKTLMNHVLRYGDGASAADRDDNRLRTSKGIGKKVDYDYFVGSRELGAGENSGDSPTKEKVNGDLIATIKVRTRHFRKNPQYSHFFHAIAGDQPDPQSQERGARGSPFVGSLQRCDQHGSDDRPSFFCCGTPYDPLLCSL